MTVAVHAATVDFQENVSGLNAGALCRTVRDHLLSPNDISSLDPQTTVIRRSREELLRNVDTPENKQTYGDKRNEYKSEGNNFPMIRSGY